MSHRLITLALAGAVVFGAGAAQADVTLNFDGGTPLAGWTLSNPSYDATAGATALPTVSTTFSHSTPTSLYVPGGSEAVYALPTAGYGDLKMWVYDPGLLANNSALTVYGPRWGGTTPDGKDPFQGAISQVSPAGSTGDVNYVSYLRAGYGGNLDTTNPSVTPFSRYTTMSSGGAASRSKAVNNWTLWDFNRPDANTMTLTITFPDSSTYVVSTNSGLTPNEVLAFAGAQSNVGPEWNGASAAAGDTVQQGFGNIEIYGGNYNDAYAGIYVDDISFTAAPVPEPASLALLALGGALLLRRRRA